MDKDEIAALARQHGPAALKALSEVADDPTAAPATRKRARLQLEARLAQLKSVAADSSLSPVTVGFTHRLCRSAPLRWYG